MPMMRMLVMAPATSLVAAALRRSLFCAGVDGRAGRGWQLGTMGRLP